MVVLGLWLGIIGYAVLYSGVAKVGGDRDCTLGRAFRGQCSGAKTTSAGVSSSGTTLLTSQRAQQTQQAQAIPATPIPQSGSFSLVQP